MKKLFTVFFIVLIICFGFVGCADSSDHTDTSQNQNGSDDLTNTLPEQKEVKEMYISINNNKLKVKLEDNTSVSALVEILKQGDITYTASDYGDFEKVGSLGHTLPANNSTIITQPGDVILYSGNQIVIFYGSNSWSYTRLGRIEGYSVSELRTLLLAGRGSVKVVLSLQ